MPVLERTEKRSHGASASEPKPKRAKKVSKRGHAPTKRYINIATVGVKPVNWLAAGPLLLLIVAAAAAVGKFAVADRLASVYEARREVAQVQEQLDAGYAALEGYDEVNAIYAHYTTTGMTEEELGRADRVAVMELLQRAVMSRTPVDSWSISGSQVSLSLNANTLGTVNEIVDELQSDALVDYCTVTTASTNGYVTSSWDVREDELVTANLVIYLNDMRGVDK